MKSLYEVRNGHYHKGQPARGHRVPATESGPVRVYVWATDSTDARERAAAIYEETNISALDWSTSLTVRLLFSEDAESFTTLPGVEWEAM